ncbi:MAG: SGNH/GDSL hydrolase family protein [Chitinophagaceae bacterium]|nr:SGNH/GDSL hydrolase family protein [Chitinophagaceae bacterium]
MRKEICLFVITVLFCQVCFAQLITKNVKTVLFLGNSITWQGNYVNDIEAYFRFKNPGQDIEFINVGLPSETVSGLSEEGHANGEFPRPDLHERLARILQQVKPDLVFASYGMNDGIYLPFDSTRFKKFKDGILWLHDEVIRAGADIIHITAADYDEVRGKSKGYTVVLDIYSDWLLSLRQSRQWEVIDVHYPMKKYLQAHRQADAKFGMDAFALAEDGVHPGETGHWIMAREILVYIGYKEIEKSPSVLQALKQTSDPIKLIKLVTERQNMLRDAWLSATKHLRPGLPTGLPLNEAQAKAAEILKEIKSLIEKK